MTYGELTEFASNQDIIIKELPLTSSDGRIKGNKIAIRHDIETNEAKACTLAEELGHYFTSIGDILDTTNQNAAKQELKARRYAHDLILYYDLLYKSKLDGCSNVAEVAEYLGITEEFLKEALENLENRYGSNYHVGQYRISFNPFDIELIN